MAERNWTKDFARKCDGKRATHALPAVVAMLLAETLEFDRPIFSRTEAEYAIFIHAWRDFDLIE